jgi:hypothetical protein
MRIPLLSALVATTLAASATGAIAAEPYGALATSPDADYGYSFNYRTERDARDRAMRECAKYSSKCAVKKVFTDTCVSIASASNGAMGWAWGFAREEGNRNAIKECRDNGGDNCRFQRRFCTGDPPSDVAD